MSYLLDALKESQRRRDQGHGDPLFQDQAMESSGFGSNDPGDSRKYLYFGALAVALSVLGGWFYSVNQDESGAGALPVVTPSAEVVGEVADAKERLAGGDATAAMVSAVEPEQPQVRDTAPSPAPEEVFTQSPDLLAPDTTGELEDIGQARDASGSAAVAVAADPVPVATPDTVQLPHDAISVQNPVVEEPPIEETVAEIGLPEIAPHTDVARVKEAQAPTEAVSTTVAAVEPEISQDIDTLPAPAPVPAPAPKQVVAETRDRPLSNAIEELYEKKPSAGADEAVAPEVAKSSGPVASADNALSPEVTSPVQDAAVAEPPVADSDESSIPHLKTLPHEVQQEIGPMTFSVHIYSRQPAKRFVNINGTKNREGDRLANGVHLDSIVSSGAIFTYKGYRFWISLR